MLFFSPREFPGGKEKANSTCLSHRIGYGSNDGLTNIKIYTVSGSLQITGHKCLWPRMSSLEDESLHFNTIWCSLGKMTQSGFSVGVPYQLCAC